MGKESGSRECKGVDEVVDDGEDDDNDWLRRRKTRIYTQKWIGRCDSRKWFFHA